MGRRSKVSVKAICKVCGHEPKGKMDGDWEVIPTTCPKCGGDVSPVVIPG